MQLQFKTFIWSNSFISQCPPVTTALSLAAHPVIEASVWISNSGGEYCSDFLSVGYLPTKQLDPEHAHLDRPLPYIVTFALNKGHISYDF